MQKTTISIRKFYIKNRTVPEWLIFFILITPFAFGLLIDMAGLPTFVRFTLDFALVALIGIMMARADKRIKRRLLPLILLFTVFTLFLFVSYLFTYQSVFYFIWGFRNNFRFIFAFFAFITFMDYDDAEQYLKIFDILFWVNLPICLIQFYLLGYKQDYLGGLFGTSVGCNVYLNVFLCTVCAKSLIYFLSKKEKLVSLLLKLFASFFIGALSELKFFYIEFIVILCIVTLITKFSWKKVLVIVLGLIGMVIGVSILIRIFPEYVGQFTLELLYESAASDKGYTSSGDINRLSAISTISKHLFSEKYHYFIGYGLGNCDLSSISVFNTPFYESHSDVNYNWFSHAFMYLETGYIGLILYLGLFILFFVCARKSLKDGYADVLHCQLAMTVSLLCLLFAVYNASLRTDAAYMIFFILALPFIKKGSSEESPLLD
ncbi:MAG: hypothetical protein E7566_03140 [Ruminococcaceae bacterium]|nr:hypothetical protein [Oscillospiraceae bacterium]